MKVEIDRVLLEELQSLLYTYRIPYGKDMNDTVKDTIKLIKTLVKQAKHYQKAYNNIYESSSQQKEDINLLLSAI